MEKSRFTVAIQRDGTVHCSVGRIHHGVTVGEDKPIEALAHNHQFISVNKMQETKHERCSSRTGKAT